MEEDKTVVETQQVVEPQVVESDKPLPKAKEDLAKLVMKYKEEALLYKQKCETLEKRYEDDLFNADYVISGAGKIDDEEVAEFVKEKYKKYAPTEGDKPRFSEWFETYKDQSALVSKWFPPKEPNQQTKQALSFAPYKSANAGVVQNKPAVQDIASMDPKALLDMLEQQTGRKIPGRRS